MRESPNAAAKGDELHLLDEAVLKVALHIREHQQKEAHQEEADESRDHPLPERLAVLLLDDPVSGGERHERERNQKVGELHAHVLEIVAHLVRDKPEELLARGYLADKPHQKRRLAMFGDEVGPLGCQNSLAAEAGYADGLVLAALDRVFEALPRARIAPVHRRVAEIADDRHVRIERDAELREERRARDGTAVRERRPHEREKDEVPRDRPAEPPRARVGEAVHTNSTTMGTQNIAIDLPHG